MQNGRYPMILFINQYIPSNHFLSPHAPTSFPLGRNRTNSYRNLARDVQFMGPSEAKIPAITSVDGVGEADVPCRARRAGAAARENLRRLLFH